MKNFIHRTFSVFILLALILSLSPATGIAWAQTSTDGTSASLTFAELGSKDLVMQGPYDSKQLRFSLPANWALQEGAEITLYIDAAFAGDADRLGGSDYVGGLLDVYFNGRLQQSIPLRVGQAVKYTIPIDATSLVPTNQDGRMDISFFLNAAFDCQFEFHRTTINILSESSLFLPYEKQDMLMDLRQLPWPIYQRDVNSPNPALLIVPDDASADELEAAMLVMAGFSRMTQGELSLELLPVSQVVEKQLIESNLIYVGSAAKIDFSKPVEWPQAASGTGGFVSTEMQSDDGILQMSVSPYNDSKTALLVSGNSDAAVVKAAQAFTTGNLQTSRNPAISYVAEVNPITSSGIIGTDNQTTTDPLNTNNYTLTDLGYTTSNSAGFGTNWFTYEFTIPPGQVPASPTYLEISFSNSALIDSNRSGMIIYLNGQPVGGARFDPSTNSLVTTRINIPDSVFVTGLNQIDIAADLIPTDVCSVFSFSGLWMTVFEDSYLHLPLVPAVEQLNAVTELKNFPVPFNNSPSLSDTLFILPSESPDLWPIAGKLAYEMGRRASGSVLAFNLVYDGSLTPEQYQGNDLVIIGQPSKLPVLGNVKDALPAGFEAGSNVAILKSQQVIYRVTERKDLGYLELLSAPWDVHNAIILIGGTSTEGATMAVDALLQSNIRDTLTGNFATVDGVQTMVVDTRTGTGIGRLATNLDAEVIIPEATAEPGVPASNSFEATRTMIFWAILVVAVVMVLVFFLALILSRQRRKKEKA